GGRAARGGPRGIVPAGGRRHCLAADARRRARGDRPDGRPEAPGPALTMSFIWPPLLLLLLAIPIGVAIYRRREARRAARAAAVGVGAGGRGGGGGGGGGRPRVGPGPRQAPGAVAPPAPGDPHGRRDDRPRPLA